MATAYAPYVPKRKNKIEKYGLLVDTTLDPIALEMEMIRRGGKWVTKDGREVGRGLFYHFMQFESLIWPHKKWHRWSELILENYLTHRSIGCLGPASSGKSYCFSTDSLADYYIFSDCTTVLICSTTREMLEQRIWGEVKKHHILAKKVRSWIPGHIKESRQRIVTATKDADVEGIDVRNGILGVPALSGGSYVGLSSFVGVKNKRVRLIADELHLLPRVFVDAISNLDKNPDFKAVGMGNPKDTTDALGIMCEPAMDLGGWDGGLDQVPGTKTWKTRRPQGICIQLPGSDSPNLDGKLGIPLITQADIDRDVAFYGTDSIWVTMMDEGKMPRGQGSRRVLTRNMAIKNRALEEPVWRNSNRVRIACLDAAYKGVGGDRCVYSEMEFGDEIESTAVDSEQEVLVNQIVPQAPIRPVIHLIKTDIIPIQANSKEEAEEQIVAYVKERCEQSGIPPEKFFFDSGMRTGLVSCFGRQWSPFVVSVDCGGPASEKQVSEQISMPCKDYYFNYVTEMWYSVRHIVESGQFRGMTEDVLMEFCQREWGMTGRNKIQVEPKEDMKLKTGRSPDLADCCFVSGTMVLTPIGERPIESIKIGDFVVTPFGTAKVERCIERDSSNIWRVDFNNGRRLIGTGNHKVFTWGLGWVSLDSLSIDNDVESDDNIPQWNILNSLFTRDESIVFKHLVDTIKTRTGKVYRKDFYTELFGLKRTALFRKVFVSIIKTAIGGIMKSVTWNWWNQRNTPAITPFPGLSSSQLALNAVRLLRSGMEVLRDLSGTRKMQRQHIPNELSMTRCALSAGMSIKHSCLEYHDSAPRDAKINCVGESRLILKELVLFAVRSFWQIVTRRRGIVLVTAPQLLQQGSKKVYNLTLDNQNVYYANGVLVQNCAIGIEGARRLGFTIKNLGKQAVVHREDWLKGAISKVREARKHHELNYD